MPSTLIKTHRSTLIKVGNTQLGSLLNSLPLNISKMDYWATGIDSDGVSLSSSVGTGGTLKAMPGIQIGLGDYIALEDGSMLMLDPNAVYDLYFETIFMEFESTATLIVLSSKALNAGTGWELSLGGANKFILYIKDTTNQDVFIKTDQQYWQIGLNKVHLTFNIPTKEITVDINGKINTFTHGRSNVFESAYPTSKFAIGHSSGNKTQYPVYIKMLKNDIPISEYLLGYRNRLTASYIRNIIDGSLTLKMFGNSKISTQDFSNPYKNGIDMYWHEETLKYVGASPVNAGGSSLNIKITDEYEHALNDYDLFKRLTTTDISYHILNYIELPDLPIFDTTNRTYWKASIEDDDYYVGGTVGKERWFHQTWLDFDWINTHIEDAYKYKFFVQSRWKKAIGQEYVKIKIENIVLFNNVPSYYKVRRDLYESESFGNFYQSTPAWRVNAITNGDKVIRIFGNLIKLSLDGGKTFVNEFDWSTIYPISDISQIHITNNGNICIFSKKTAVHYSDDNLATVKASAVLDIDGSPYVFHTPANASYPGGYFQLLNSFQEDENCIVIGSYANSGTGANPINLYYSVDSGVTWKIFYVYGQNPAFTDNGTANGGTGGTLLGDSENSIITTKVEGINIGNDGNFYVGTEGGTIGGVSCNTMMKCSYNAVLDEWTVVSIINSESMKSPRFRANGCWEKDGFIYWAPAQADHGIFKCLVSEIDNTEKHILLSFPTEGVSVGAGCTVYDKESGKAFVSYTTEIHLSADHGETWEIFEDNYAINLLPTFYDKINDWWCSGREVITQYLK